tara:strand:+ start:100 stop:549 length:450 start_codon:yes stop_codon:yes gene_type:complete
MDKDKIYEMNDKDIELLLSNLEILSKIQVNNKLIYINNKLEIDNTYYLQPFYRWYNNYNRVDTIYIINNLVKNILYISDFFIQKIKYNKEDKYSFNMLKKIYSRIYNACDGFDKLIVTYNDKTITVKITECKVKLLKLHQQISNVFISD